MGARQKLFNNSLLTIRARFLFLLLTFVPLSGALAQFSTPYDPDFAPEQTPTPSPQSSPSPQPVVSVSSQTAAPSAIVVPAPGPFLLMDRPDPEHLFAPTEAAPEQPSIGFEEFQKQLPTLRLDTETWDKMRSDTEQGTVPNEEFVLPTPTPGLGAPPMAVVVSTPPPAPVPPEVEMASYGTSLSVAGRKIVGVNFAEKRFLSPQVTTGRPQVTNNIGITQQLQLRMQGKVGQKVGVNIDYDDTKPNKQDISVVYSGDPNDVVQNASFGDIDLSLPATEFVSYNKQLFGIRADIKYKGFKATFIGSRTKGTTKTKQFIGNTQFATVDIPDNSYVRRQYYDLTFGNPARLPLVQGSERVFLAQQNPIGQLPPTAQQLTADDLAVPTSTFTGTFVPLLPGQDYTMDYAHGILTLRSPALPQFVIAVDFIDASGNHIVHETSTSTFTGPGTGDYKLIKTNADVFISTPTEVGYNREIKTEYSIGQVQLVRDDGRGSFILRVIDPQTRNEVGSTLNPVQQYPQTINVDFENGLFKLVQPFGVSTSTPTPDPDLYSPTPISKRLIHVEYHFRLKTFLLEPNIVLQSDIILIDGVRLVRNVDYFIDYDSGFVTFFNPNRIGPTSEVDITYEVAPFAGVTSDSILGSRVSYDFNKNASIGTTVLYESGTKPTIVPQITDLARSLLVYDADAHYKDVKLFGNLKGSFQGELAQSRLDPNLSGNALVDNMEGILQQNPTGLLASQWQIASNPGGVPSDPQSINWVNEDTPILQINPNAQAKPTDSQKTLDMDYNFGVNGTEEVSIVFPFSPTGLDFSKLTTLQVIMKGDASNNLINFRLGGINEDADGTGGTTLACANGQSIPNAPKTEDVNCNGILDPGEDIGWLYSPVGLNSIRYGAGNGKIDTESLSGDFTLHPDDLKGDNYGYAPAFGNGGGPQLFDATTSSTRTAVDFGGSTWHTFQIPLNISTTTFANWTAIKQIRISLKHAAGSPNTGVISFAQVSVVGNTWLPGAAGDLSNGSGPIGTEALAVNAINNVSNPNYIPIYNAGGDAQQVFSDLYGSVSNLQQQSGTQNISEQALQLSWSNLSPGTTVFTERIFTKPIDVSQHKSFSFLLFGNADRNHVDVSGKKIFFLRAGSDQNFFEMRIPLDFIGWQKFTANQIDPNGTQIASAWTVGKGTPSTVIVSSGTPNLQQVAELVAGVYSSTGSASTQGSAYLDEIYVSNPISRVGNAYKLQADFDLPDWATFGLKRRYMDHNFTTPTTVVTNQDNQQDTSYLNLTHWKYMPLNFTLARTITNTPNTAATGNLSNTVNLLQEGRVINWNGTATGNLVYGSYPHLTLGYVRAVTEYDLLTRYDDRSTYNSALSYAVPSKLGYVPKTVDLNYSYSKYSVSFQSLDARLTPGNFNTNEYTNTYGTRLSFIPWLGSSFNPNYTATVVNEHRDDMTSGVDVNSSYPKALNQTAGFSSNFKINRWLNPSINYTSNTIENEILYVSTFVVGNSTAVFNPGDIKTVNQSDNGSITLPLNAVDLFPKTRLFHSFNLANSYQMQDGAVWNNVESGLNTRTIFNVRTQLHPSSIAAQLANETLRDTFNSTQRWSPFEAYGLLGRIAAFKTLSISNNFVESIQRTSITGTYTRTTTTTLPDLVASMGQLEKILWTERWMSNGQINVKYAAHHTVAAGQSETDDDAFGTDLRAILWKRFDSTISFNRRASQTTNLALNQPTGTTFHEDGTVQTTFDVQKFRFTPKVDYTHDTASQGGAATQDDTVVTPSMLVRADLSLPKGLMLPFMSRPLFFSNRIIWTSTVSLAIRSSPVTLEDNSKTFTLNSSADYELAKNLRMTLNGSVSRLWHRYIAEENYISYSFGTTFTFQF